MKHIEKYKELGVLSENAAFSYIIDNLKDTIRTYDFFVAWEKVVKNVSEIEIALNILNSLIGKENLEEKKYSESTVNEAVTAVRSFYSHFEIPLPRMLFSVRGNRNRFQSSQ